MKKILVPTDFSKPAILASEIACSIAKKSNAQIILLHVVEQPSSESFNVEAQFSNPFDIEDKVYVHKLLQKKKGQLTDAAAQIVNAGVEVVPLLRLGNTFHGMRTIITEYKADLIVMGSSGHSVLEDGWIGSNTEKVVRHAKCPVLTVHQKPSGTEFKNIVFATSMNESERSFIDTLKQMQEIYGSTIHLVRINTPMNFRSDMETKRVMNNFAITHKLKSCTLNVFNAHSEEEGIRQFAASVQADMIAMATHGRTNMSHIIMGSIAEDVVNHSSRPVLTCVVN